MENPDRRLSLGVNEGEKLLSGDEPNNWNHRNQLQK